MSTVISVENLSKTYHLGQIGTGTFANDLKVWWAKTRGKPNPLLKIGQTDHGNLDGEELWALRDINFTVQQGEVMGIIGKNGAGKSTLLKILSRVTAPTSGKIKVNGRIASLLEVGTGFHPDLTGRENIYLNGAILGMSRMEINRKFNEIVDFAEVEKFIDTPVKRYSSGMYVRLAFAVAAHLDPEILVVDEVLAVGDAEFQKKCLGKMGEVAEQGRTVFFVSHNMTSISNLCQRAILLDSGMLAADGEAEKIVEKYLSTGNQANEQVWETVVAAPGDHRVRLHAIRAASGGISQSQFDIDKPVNIEVEYWNLLHGNRMIMVIMLIDSSGAIVFETMNTLEASLSPDPWCCSPLPEGLFRSTCTIPSDFLNETVYYVNVIISTSPPPVAMVNLEKAISFSVFDTGGMRSPGLSGKWYGGVRPRFAWKTEPLSDESGK